MLHEILLSLSGHPSPLLTANNTTTSILSPPEKALLSSLSHLSTLHDKLLTHTSQIASTHPSSICEAVTTSISSVHLTAFQRKILEVEDGILRKDAGNVGAYNIVPLTAIVREFSGWTRRMEWFLEIVEFMMRGTARGAGTKCSGAKVIDRLCEALQTGYVDVEEVAGSLVAVAEKAWLKQVAAWILYGRLPSFGREDFFVEEVDDGALVDYKCNKELLPAFVSLQTASSLLFIGRSLNHIRVKGMSSTTTPELNLLSSHLHQLSSLSFPISSAHFSKVIETIRLSLSQMTLQKLLPLSRVVGILTLLGEFFLLGRGEFAMALINEADEKIRSRWRRADNLGYEKREGLSNIVVKDGEVSAVLSRTWAALGSLQGQHEEDEDEDELLELARDLMQLNITKSNTSTPLKTSLNSSQSTPMIVSTPFKNLLLSVPVTLTLRIPSPLDLFLTPTDLQTYSSINSYLLSIRRAHLRLTDLWKITSLRRAHPAPPGPPYGSSTAGRQKVHTLRERAKVRSAAMRSVWATSSAAVFFLGETEAYLQGEVVQGSWSAFKNWLDGDLSPTVSRPATSSNHKFPDYQEQDEDEEDLFLHLALTSPPEPTQPQPNRQTHDPQTLSQAHTNYLSTLTTSLLLTSPSFTDPLYHLLQQIDHLVALVHRLNSIWQSMDLEADEGVVDAFSDWGKEEVDVRIQLGVVEGRVKGVVREIVEGLRGLDGVDGAGKEMGVGMGGGVGEGEDGFRPKRVGRVDRLLMKLDFGVWFDEGGKVEGVVDGEEREA